MKKLKKILSFCLASFMLIVCMSFSVNADDNTDRNKIIYDYLCDDYCAVTDMSKEAANDVFEHIDINIISDVESKYIAFDSEDNLEQTILYLQDNYVNIVDGLSDVEKYDIDAYLLLISIKYYADNFNWIMSENDKATVASDEPAVSVEDSLIDGSIENNVSLMGSGNNTKVTDKIIACAGRDYVRINSKLRWWITDFTARKRLQSSDEYIYSKIDVKLCKDIIRKGM